MNNNIEKEYKVLVTKEQFYNLYQNFATPPFHEQVNIYYDTQDLMIRKHKGAMRIRDVNGMHIFTLKMQSEEGLLEFEKPVPKNAITSLEDEEIQELLHRYQLQGPFFKIAELHTQRAVYESEFAELCFDISTYHGKTDYEIEYEYKKEHDCLSIFQDIMKQINVVYEKNCISKIQRAINSL